MAVFSSIKEKYEFQTIVLPEHIDAHSNGHAGLLPSGIK